MAGRISKIRERIARNRERLQARIEADIQKSEEQLKQANLVYERTIEEHLQRRLGREWRKGLSVYLDHVSHEDPEKGSCLVVSGLDDGMRKLILTGAEEDEIFDLSENVGKAEKVQEKAEMGRRVIPDMTEKIAFLDSVTPYDAASPRFDVRGYQGLGNRFYSLWLRASPIFRVESNNTMAHLATTRKDKPLEIRTTNTHDAKRVTHAEELLGLGEGSLCTGDLYVLDGEQERVASEVYERVQRGERILPSEDLQERLGTPKAKIELPFEPQFRTWGQQFLTELAPREVTEGQILGSGNSYQAYHFQVDNTGRVVVEANGLDRATYLFTNEGFKQYGDLPRSMILTEKPKGFEGRVIHPCRDSPAERSRWQEAILQYLTAEAEAVK